MKRSGIEPRSPGWLNSRTILLYTHIHADVSRNIMTNSMNEQTHFFRKIYTSHTLFSKGLRKGWCWLCVRGELERDCHTLIPSSSDHSSTSSSFCWAAQPGSWGPKPSVWSWFSLRHLIFNWNCTSNWTDSSCLWHLVI